MKTFIGFWDDGKVTVFGGIKNGPQLATEVDLEANVDPDTILFAEAIGSTHLGIQSKDGKVELEDDSDEYKPTRFFRFTCDSIEEKSTLAIIHKDSGSPALKDWLVELTPAEARRWFMAHSDNYNMPVLTWGDEEGTEPIQSPPKSQS